MTVAPEPSPSLAPSSDSASLLPPSDRLDILDVITRADNAAGRRDAATYLSLYTEHAVIDGTQGDYRGESALRDGITAVWASEPTSTLHLTQNAVIAASNESAATVDSVLLLVSASAPSTLLLAASITQHLQKIDGSWKIAHRTVHAPAPDATHNTAVRPEMRSQVRRRIHEQIDRHRAPAVPDGPIRPEVRDAPEAGRVEAWVGNSRTGFGYYHHDFGRLVLTDTVVDPYWQGHGIASAMVRTLFEQARAAGRTVVPICEYTRGWIRAHPDYIEFVSPDFRDAVLGVSKA